MKKNYFLPKANMNNSSLAFKTANKTSPPLALPTSNKTMMSFGESSKQNVIYFIFKIIKKNKKSDLIQIERNNIKITSSVTYKKQKCTIFP